MNAESSNHRSGREPPQKPIRPHVETGNAKTSFFSRVSPDMIEEALVNYLNQRSITAKQRPRKYQIDFSYLLPNASAVTADMTEGCQQSEEVQVRVKISQVVNGDTFTEGPTYCVEFSRIAGDTLDFNQAYNIFFQEALSFAIEDI